jgi:hypothetical protein
MKSTTDSRGFAVTFGALVAGACLCAQAVTGTGAASRQRTPLAVTYVANMGVMAASILRVSRELST